MSKSKSKKDRKKRNNNSKIKDHLRQGTNLIAPFRQIDNLKFVSWRDDRLPEMLWAALIVSNINREVALDLFRSVVEYFLKLSPNNRPKDMTHTELAKLPDDILEEFISIISKREDSKKALSILTRFNTLPKVDIWRKVLNLEDEMDDWSYVELAVIKNLDHQSQEATDCRWLRIYYYCCIGKFSTPNMKEILLYPNEGDMRMVRPSIRAAENGLDTLNGLDGNIEESWAPYFWEECLKNTSCRSLRYKNKNENNTKVSSLEKVNDVTTKLEEHFYKCLKSTEIDAKYDSIFGIALYSLNLLKEIHICKSENIISGRLILRSIVECYITISYLDYKNDEKLWMTYRNYGSGQVKLTFLKLDELEDVPNFIDKELLELLADEDMWKEFVNINLGNWDKSNLRQMSTNAGVKDIYDSYYGWSSAFIHGQWGAIRDSVYETCGNPLHRLHRIPKKKVMLNSVEPDAVYLVDKILGIVDKNYPDFKYNLNSI